MPSTAARTARLLIIPGGISCHRAAGLLDGRGDGGGGRPAGAESDVVRILAPAPRVYHEVAEAGASGNGRSGHWLLAVPPLGRLDWSGLDHRHQDTLGRVLAKDHWWAQRPLRHGRCGCCGKGTEGAGSTARPRRRNGWRDTELPAWHRSAAPQSLIANCRHLVSFHGHPRADPRSQRQPPAIAKATAPPHLYEAAPTPISARSQRRAKRYRCLQRSDPSTPALSPGFSRVTFRAWA